MHVSIIIPCFNHEKYVADAIESALYQTIPSEVIFINDGSTDNSLEIARRYPIRIVDQVNKGLASARNTGIMWATGGFVLPLDSDDILLPDAVEIILKAAKVNPDADVIAPSFKCFGLNNSEVILMQNPTLEDFKGGNRIGYFSAVKRQALLEVGGYSPKMTWGWEDMALWINLLSRGKKIVTLKEILVLYRTKEISMITEANKHSEELMAQIRKDFPQW